MNDIESDLAMQAFSHSERRPLPLPSVEKEVSWRPESFNDGISDKWYVVEPHVILQLFMRLQLGFNVVTMLLAYNDPEIVELRYSFYPTPANSLLRSLCGVTGVGANEYLESNMGRRTCMETRSFVERDIGVDL
jgi:hypothetical protein